MDIEKLYRAVNTIYECVEANDISTAKEQLEGLLNDIKYGLYE